MRTATSSIGWAIGLPTFLLLTILFFSSQDSSRIKGGEVLGILFGALLLAGIAGGIAAGLTEMLAGRVLSPTDLRPTNYTTSHAANVLRREGYETFEYDYGMRAWANRSSEAQ